MGSEVTQIVIMLAIGAAAGWLAGVIMRGMGFGLIGNIIVGIVGSIIGTFVGGMLSPALGVTMGGLGGTFLWSVIGAVILLFILSLIKKPIWLNTTVKKRKKAVFKAAFFLAEAGLIARTNTFI